MCEQDVASTMALGTHRQNLAWGIGAPVLWQQVLRYGEHVSVALAHLSSGLTLHPSGRC